MTIQDALSRLMPSDTGHLFHLSLWFSNGQGQACDISWTCTHSSAGGSSRTTHRVKGKAAAASDIEATLESMVPEAEDMLLEHFGYEPPRAGGE